MYRKSLSSDVSMIETEGKKSALEEVVARLEKNHYSLKVVKGADQFGYEHLGITSKSGQDSEKGDRSNFVRFAEIDTGWKKVIVAPVEIVQVYVDLYPEEYDDIDKIEFPDKSQKIAFVELTNKAIDLMEAYEKIFLPKTDQGDTQKTIK